MNIPQETLDYYLFGCDPTKVIKRIVQLYRMRCLSDSEFYDLNLKPPLILSDEGEGVG